MEKFLEAVSQFTYSDALLLETYDRQFKALKRLLNSCKDPESFLKLVLLNALLSYQLSMKGEDYWEAFADFFSRNGCKLELFEEFLSRYNRRFLGAKLKRLRKALNCVSRFNFPLKDLSSFVEELAECMGQNRDAKTVVFAAKMLTYAHRLVYGKEPSGVEAVEIPLDSRLKRVLPSVQEWRELAERLGIPPLHLDAVVWVPMGLNKEQLQELPPALRSKVANLIKALVSEGVL